MRVKREELLDFAFRVMKKIGCDEDKARIVADVLVEADMRGINSHGVARLRRYVNHIREGIIDPSGEPEIVYETPVSAVVNGHNGVGQYIAKFSMRKAIEKARVFGVGMIIVRNSNHHGIAGYYAEMATSERMVGISLSNTSPMLVPTFSKEALLGTNPIAFAFPRNERYPILVDMATSVVPKGKLEVYSRLNRPVPVGWAVDESGCATTDPQRVLTNMNERRGGGLLPLGGAGEEFGGHKGYGLALIVELLSAGLSLGSFSFDTYMGKGKVAHFFAAIDLSLFGDPQDIIKHVEKLVKRLKSAKKAEGAERIYLHGEKEYEQREESLKLGVEIDEPTRHLLKNLAEDLGVRFNL